MAQSDDPFTPGTIVMWLDPGKVTGWAKLTDGEVYTSGEANFYQLGDILRYHCMLRGFKLGWERFDFTPAVFRMREANWPLEVIGMARWLAYGTADILPPAARAARNMIKPDMFKAIGWHKPGLGHANDAGKHLAAWAIRNDVLPASVADRITSFLEAMDS